MVIPLIRFNLSEHAKHLLHSIYDEYQIHKDSHVPDSYTSRTLPSHFLFSGSDNSQVMPGLAELASKGMIRLFSDNRIMIRLQAISYIERQLAKHDNIKL